LDAHVTEMKFLRPIIVIKKDKNQKSRLNRNTVDMNVQLNPNEIVLKACDSKFHTDPEVLGGKLILTNQRVFFTIPETISEDISIWPTAIKEIIHFSTGIFSNNGMKIVMKDGNDLRFTLKDRDQWTRLINKMY
jgi:hypothetical protein